MIKRSARETNLERRLRRRMRVKGWRLARDWWGYVIGGTDENVAL